MLRALSSLSLSQANCGSWPGHGHLQRLLGPVQSLGRLPPSGGQSGRRGYLGRRCALHWALPAGREGCQAAARQGARAHLCDWAVSRHSRCAPCRCGSPCCSARCQLRPCLAHHGHRRCCALPPLRGQCLPGQPSLAARPAAAHRCAGWGPSCHIYSRRVIPRRRVRAWTGQLA